MYFQNADRREYPRYRTSLAAELITPDARISSSLIDISPAGASLSCWPLDDDAAVTLRIAGFGDLKVSRLRGSGSTERLLFRDSELRSLQWMKFLVRLVDSGAASAAIQRRAHAPSLPLLGATAKAGDELAACVDQALNMTVQINSLDGHIPENVVLFPVRRRLTDQFFPPDQPA